MSEFTYADEEYSVCIVIHCKSITNQCVYCISVIPHRTEKGGVVWGITWKIIKE